jgi:hypothetical protein
MCRASNVCEQISLLGEPSAQFSRWRAYEARPRLDVDAATSAERRRDPSTTIALLTLLREVQPARASA